MKNIDLKPSKLEKQFFPETVKPKISDWATFFYKEWW